MRSTSLILKGVASKRHFSNHEFLGLARDYLPLDAVVRQIGADGNPGERVHQHGLRENTFYQLDADAVVAIGNAIEDLALEEADGSLIGCFQHFKDFEAHRERYGHLAATIERVEVLAGGRIPSRIRHLKFTQADRKLCKDYRAILYEGRQRRALLICQQMNPVPKSEDRNFLGFYTFNPWLINRIGQELVEFARGQRASLPEFMRQQSIDRTAKQIKMEFAREKEALNLAVSRLQADSGRYEVRHFMSDLEKGLSRLQQWKARMPEIVAPREGQARP